MVAPALLASTAIILLSFVSEDAATVSSALSVFGGPLLWPFSFASCFAGIWIGDLGLYALARCIGRPILQSRWVRRFADAESVTRCEQTITKNGTAALLVSRFIPGTRLPTYLAAGLFRMPARRFAAVTALGALVWISIIFGVAKIFGSDALFFLSARQNKLVMILGYCAVLAGTLIVFRKAIRAVVATVGDPGRAEFATCDRSRGHRPRLQRFIRRITSWEFWPTWLFYLPVALNYVSLGIKYRSFTLPTAANPGIPTGGFIGESKSQILAQLSDINPRLVADAYLLDGHTPTDRLLSLHRICRQHHLTLPFILKPDVGQRGNGVRLIREMREALDYLLVVDAPVMIQRYAGGPNEAGVFYFRRPAETHGQIFSITEKIFPSITGDGIHSIEELIRWDDRASLIAPTYLRRFANRKNEVLSAGKILKLVETGNHAQGCIFRDGSHLWSERLAATIDGLARKFPGFYVGRFDIRYANVDEFRDGRNFTIVELNGASSEATSIYDARNSLRSAYATLARQWKLVFEIGAANRARGHGPASLGTLWREWHNYSSMSVAYPCAS